MSSWEAAPGKGKSMNLHIPVRMVAAGVLLVSAAAAQTWRKADPKDWVQLFNGTNLDGWTPKITGFEFGDNFGNTFRVEKGVLKVAYDKYEKFGNRFGHMFYKDKFSRYVIAVEYRFTGDQ